ncbi:MAG: PadR family transcriptional regulator [Candidatus Hodarchaeota archaeon]
MIKRVKEFGTEALITSQEIRDYVEKFESEINRGISTLCILAIINGAENREIHGYAILKNLEKETNEMLVIEEGTLYPLLRKLEGNGILKSERKIVDNRMRKVYSITEIGDKVYNHISGFYSKLTEAISPLLGIAVRLNEQYLYCPNCANKIDLEQDKSFCDMCGLNIQELREGRLGKDVSK